MTTQIETDTDRRDGLDAGRRTRLKLTGAGVAALGVMSATRGPALAQDTEDWDKTFPQSNLVDHQKVSFTSRLGITLVADLHTPRDLDRSNRHPALVVGHPFGIVKEQTSSLYAQTMAERGLITLAHGASFQGESGAVANSLGTPETIADESSAMAEEFFAYYRTPRGRHPRSTTETSLTGAGAMMQFRPFEHLDMISPRPIPIVSGEVSMSRMVSEDAYARAAEPKDLHIVPGAGQVDLYDRVDLIHWDELQSFFEQHLA
jgi:fermentation-respiration switch protein FrsA (DUF1100 family)